MYNRRFLVLFYIRMLVYLLVVGIPIFHPAVVVSYDSQIRWLWFLLVPAQMLLAFYLAIPQFKPRVWVGSSFGLIVVSLFVFTGINGPIGLFALVQIAAFATTALIFRSRGLARPLVFCEVPLLVWLLVKLLGFSRASEQFAAASSGVTQAILAIGLGAILLHGFVLYLAVYGEGIRRRGGRELAMFLTIAAAIGVAAALFMPADFVNHSISLNDLKNPPDPDFVPLDEYGDGLEGGNLLSDRPNDDRNGDSGNAGEEGEDGGDAQGNQRLRGIPAEQWDSRRGTGSEDGDGEAQEGEEGEGESRNGSGEGENNQYAVMVVASDQDPVYAADAYFGHFDPVRGFTVSRDNPLNELAYIRLIETWENPAPVEGSGRELKEVFFISTEPRRYIPFDPRAVQPTILNKIYHPFDFSYATLSEISQTTPAK